MKKTNLDALNAQLFETIEMLKNNNDPEASDNEKIDVTTAQTIADLAKVVVEGYKVKANVIKILSDSDELFAARASATAGILDEEPKQIANN